MIQRSSGLPSVGAAPSEPHRCAALLLCHLLRTLCRPRHVSSPCGVCCLFSGKLDVASVELVLRSLGEEVVIGERRQPGREDGKEGCGTTLFFSSCT